MAIPPAVVAFGQTGCVSLVFLDWREKWLTPRSDRGRRQHHSGARETPSPPKAEGTCTVPHRGLVLTTKTRLLSSNFISSSTEGDTEFN